MVRAIVFDFYGVFLPDSYSVWLAKNNLERSGIFSELITKLDTGEIDEQTFLDQLSRSVGRTVQSNEIHDSAAVPDTELITLIEKLHTKYTIGLFSNASSNLRSTLEKFGLVSLFDTIIISSDIGYAKPSDKAFESAIAALMVEPEEILFIDDNVLNVVAARNNKILAVQYEGVDNLQTTLQKYKLL